MFRRSKRILREGLTGIRRPPIIHVPVDRPTFEMTNVHLRPRTAPPGNARPQRPSRKEYAPWSRHGRITHCPVAAR
ncbi:hypothetical protein GCM10010360_06350 [Streptomyces nogalater]